MPDPIDTAKTLKVNAIRGDLNVVLSADQVNHIIRSVAGANGEKLADLVALVSDHCCVDASVGSSVAGPFTGVASSVSVPAPEGVLNTRNIGISDSKLKQKINEGNLNVGIRSPTSLIVK